MAAHGARGPDEWELASPTWGTDRRIALGAIDRLWRAPAERDPAAARVRLGAERAAAIARVSEGLPRPVRPVLRRLARSAALYAEARERAKAIFVEDLFALRLALFELVRRAQERGGPADRFDCFMVTMDELPVFVADPVTLGATIAERRARWDYLDARVPPFVFVGQVPDPATWPLRSAAAAQGPMASGTLTGLGVCAGRARGTVRVITDPTDPGALQPGDILVAPITDPAWTPLFLAAAGVVVEVGAQQSHAAIVARELGIPAVVSVAGATAHLRDGQLVEVDGSAGTVSLLPATVRAE